ncbi:hypothetical protein FQ192_11225 [Pseudomonas sp. ANT_J12]|nr:hypothetical protein FQ192_11225 [Pseudomonas sp. ANT_J12]
MPAKAIPRTPSRASLAPTLLTIVPTLCVGTPQGTLRVPALERDAERPGLHSHAERGNDQRHKTNVGAKLAREGNLRDAFAGKPCSCKAPGTG